MPVTSRLTATQAACGRSLASTAAACICSQAAEVQLQHLLVVWVPRQNSSRMKTSPCLHHHRGTWQECFQGLSLHWGVCGCGRPRCLTAAERAAAAVDSPMGEVAAEAAVVGAAAAAVDLVADKDAAYAVAGTIAAVEVADRAAAAVGMVGTAAAAGVVDTAAAAADSAADALAGMVAATFVVVAEIPLTSAEDPCMGSAKYCQTPESVQLWV